MMKKKIVSILLALVMAIGMLPATVFAADSDTKISTVVATLAETLNPTHGAALKEPKISVSTGAPAFFSDSMYGWYKQGSGGWEFFNDATFIAGTYRYSAQLRVADSNGGEGYVLATDGLAVTVDGVAWTVGTVKVYDTYSYVTVYSPEFVVAEPDDLELTFIDREEFDIDVNYVSLPIDSFSVAEHVEGGTKPYTFSKVSGPDWVTVSGDGTISGNPTATGENADLVVKVTDSAGPAAEKTITIAVGKTYGNPAAREKISTVVATLAETLNPTHGAAVNKPKITVTEGTPAYFPDTMYAWQKKNDDTWEYVSNEMLKFAEGIYRYSAQLRVDNEKGGDGYVLAETGLTVTVDGVAWTVGTVKVEDGFSYVFVYSPEFTVTPDSVATPEIYVGGVGMVSGDYLAEGASAAVAKTPAASDDNYAYYENGELTLKNYDYTGAGAEIWGEYFLIARVNPEDYFEELDLQIIYEGTNKLTGDVEDEESDCAGIYAAGDLTLTAEDESASLEITAEAGLRAKKDVVISGGTVIVTSTDGSAIVANTDLTITDSTVTANADGTYALKAGTDLTITDSTVTAVAKEYALHTKNVAFSGNSYVDAKITYNPGSFWAIRYDHVGSAGTFTYDGLNIQAAYKLDEALGTFQLGENQKYARVVIKAAAPAPTTYTVTFNANGGTVSPANATTGTDGKLSSLPTPTREGYTFDGWFTAAEGGTEVTVETVYSTNTTIYAQWTEVSAPTPEIWVGGIGMNSGDYLAEGASAAVAKTPAASDDNYAYYKDGVLTLKNYDYSGAGYEYVSGYGAAIYSPDSVTIELLDGTASKLEATGYYGVCVNNRANTDTELTISGNGTLEIDATYYGVYAYGDLIVTDTDLMISADKYALAVWGELDIDNSTLDLTAGEYGIYAAVSVDISNEAADVVEITSDEYGIYAQYETVTLSGGSYIINGGTDGIFAYDTVSVTSDDLSIKSANTENDEQYYAIKTYASITFVTDLTVLASTEPDDSNPETYDAAKNDTYDYIKIAPKTAPEPTMYPVWVLGTQVTSDNKDDVLNDGKVSYDPDTNTLTVSRDLAATGDQNAVRAFTSGVLHIQLSGDRSISSENAGVLYTSNSVEITSDGDVTITCASDVIGPIPNLKVSTSGDVTLENTNGKICNSSLTITGVDGGAAGNVKVNADTTALSGGKFVAQTITVNASGDVEITNESGAVSVNALTVTGADDVTVTGDTAGFLIIPSANIAASGDVTMENANGGICAANLTISGIAGDAAENVKVSANTKNLDSGKFVAQAIEVKAAGDVAITNEGGSVAVTSVDVIADEVLIVGSPAGFDTAVFSYENVDGAAYVVYEGASEADLSVVKTKAAGETYSGNMDVNVIKITAKKPSGGGGGSAATYAITVENSDNGEISASKKSASKGTDITLTVKADEGYELDILKVLDKNGDKVKVTKKGDKYTFEMPASKVTVTATFSKIEVEPAFEDVAEDAYYFDAVEWAVKEGITSGTSATTFSPNAPCTRAQAVTFLWRAAGSPEPESTEMPFEDVADGAYYYDAVLWAVENGITAGTSATTFAPNATCTRAQIVTFLWRSQKSPAGETVNPFTDVAAEAYYYDAVLWAVENGVTAGTSATTFAPDATCTRAQIVTFLFRALGDKE